MTRRPDKPAQWRSLDELADTPEFRAALAAEFPALAQRVPLAGRRRFLGALAATLALGGLSGCGRSESVDERSRIVPYVRQPTDAVPSAALYYSTATLLDGFANGAVAITRDGRPIKIEGNAAHPWSRGGTDVFMQASVLGLYDSDRSQAVRFRNRITDWPSFIGAMTSAMSVERARGGEGLRLLTGPITSPTLLRQIGRMQAAFPQMQWHMYVPSGVDAQYGGTAAAFGVPLQVRWNFAQARVIVAVQGDFLDHGPHQVGSAQAWSRARAEAAARGELLTLHCANATPTLTSAKADYPAVIPAGAIDRVLDGLAAVAQGGDVPPDMPAWDWVQKAGKALRDAQGAGLVQVGLHLPAETQARGHRLNAALEQIGRTVSYSDPLLPRAAGLPELICDMQDGRVGTLLMLDSNPVYTAPGALGFADALNRVKLRINAGMHVDETALRSDWHLPLSHPLETWGDARAYDGTISLLQPTMLPLYDTRSQTEILALLTYAYPADGQRLLRSGYQADDTQWRDWLLAGFVAGSALPDVPVKPSAATTSAPGPATGLTVFLRPDPSVWDGSFANNGWLQELPRPLTKVTWDNVVAISPRLAEAHKLRTGDRAQVAAGGRALNGAVWVLPGQADDTVTVTLGYGRSTGSVGEGVGFDAYALLPADGAREIAGAALERVSGRVDLATTQLHDAIDGDGLVRVQPLGAAPVGDGGDVKQPDFFPPAPSDGRAWGMVIDIDACIGCNACVIACQAENNIPVVGAENIREGRGLHWLRVDRYYEGPSDDPQTHFMPVPCMMCEHAPCELGCPVEATLHDREGLNLQVYNRCIGTRACSGYCPYKVRRFNYFDFSDAPASIQAQRNPDVTVRARGVMEKCTYCVQRIAAARLIADNAQQPIPDGTVKTACQQACPANAIVFGDLADTASAVRRLRHDGRNYSLLGELNTRPRTTYLAARAPAETQQG